MAFSLFGLKNFYEKKDFLKSVVVLLFCQANGLVT